MSQDSSEPRVSQTALNVDCRICGYIGAVEPEDAPILVLGHFAQVHGQDAVQDVVNGRDYEVYTAVARCDVCGTVAEPPWWHHEASTPMNGPVIDQDGQWLMCDACHEAFTARSHSGLVRLMMSAAADMSPILASQQELALQHRVLASQQVRELFRCLDAGRRMHR